MKKGLFIFLLLGSCFASLSQDSSLVRFYVRGSESFYIRLNGELLPNNNIHKLAKGEYDVEIWSPQYLTHTGKLDVSGKQDVSYVAELVPDPKHWEYLVAKENYKKKVFAYRTLPILLVGLGGLSAPIFLSNAKNKHEDYVKANFNPLTGELTAKTTEDLKRQYRTSQSLTIGALSFVGIGAVAYVAFTKKIKGLERPKYQQQNPFTLEYFNLSYNNIQNVPQATLSLRF
jgi:hypothetical protein